MEKISLFTKKLRVTGAVERADAGAAPSETAAFEEGVSAIRELLRDAREESRNVLDIRQEEREKMEEDS